MTRQHPSRSVLYRFTTRVETLGVARCNAERYPDGMRNAVVSAEFAEQADKMRSIIATNFSDMLEENRWSRRAAAEALGLTHTYVNSRATGDVEMSGSDIMLFASFLGVSEAEFFAANRPKPKSNVRILNTAKNAGKLRNDNSHRPVVSLADWKRSA